jgi:hypothetical protein
MGRSIRHISLSSVRIGVRSPCHRYHVRFDDPSGLHFHIVLRPQHCRSSWGPACLLSGLLNRPCDIHNSEEGGDLCCNDCVCFCSLISRRRVEKQLTKTNEIPDLRRFKLSLWGAPEDHEIRKRRLERVKKLPIMRIYCSVQRRV